MWDDYLETDTVPAQHLLHPRLRRGVSALADRRRAGLICRMTTARPAPARQRRIPPIIAALALLTVGGALTVGIAWLFAEAGVALPPLAAGLLTGVLGAMLGRLAGLDSWWMVIQCLFPVGILVARGAPVPPWIWLALFFVLVVVYWSTFRTQVPLYLSSSKVREALVPLLPDGPFRFIDVGSGVGGVLTDLARRRADGEYHGIESAPLPYLVSRLRIALGRHRNCHAHWGSFWSADLTSYDVVFAYLSPVPMAALWEKARAELRPGATFISNTFVVDVAPPTRMVQVDDLHRSTLYVWSMP